jgi:hypothetical protein
MVRKVYTIDQELGRFNTPLQHPGHYYMIGGPISKLAIVWVSGRRPGRDMYL